MASIRLTNVAKIYRGRDREITAISDIFLEIAQGEFVFIVGSRSAGKSTLLDIIAGELKPDRGTVFLDDEDLNKGTKRQMEKMRMAFGRIGQETELNRTETVYFNLGVLPPGPFPQLRFLQKKGTDPAVADKALALVGMSGSGDRIPREMTQSEGGRVQLAKAILNSPSILLLDNFTDQMDNDTAWDMLHLLADLNHRGTTIIMATNSSYIVNTMRRRVVTLADGRIVGDVKKGRYGYIG